jgi:nucleotide-binding universal stress UspA family protein
MDPKDILLILTPGEPNAARLSAAEALARTFGAQVSGVCIYETPMFPIEACFAVGEADVQVLERQDRRIADLLAPLAAAFGKTFAEMRPPAVWEMPAANELADVTAARARTVDLVVVGRGVEGPKTSLARLEALVLGGGASCLLVPEDGGRAPRLDRVLVAWNGSRVAKRALDDAMVFLKRAKAVEVAVGAEPGHEVDETEVAALLDHLSRHGVEASLRRLETPGYAGDVLVEACRRFRADLLVMGAYGHSRMVEAVLGGVTRAMLADPPLPILISC